MDICCGVPLLSDTTNLTLLPDCVSANLRNFWNISKVCDFRSRVKMNQYFEYPLTIFKKYLFPPQEVGVMGLHRSMWITVSLIAGFGKSPSKDCWCILDTFHVEQSTFFSVNDGWAASRYLWLGCPSAWCNFRELESVVSAQLVFRWSVNKFSTMLPIKRTSSPLQHSNPTGVGRREYPSFR